MAEPSTKKLPDWLANFIPIFVTAALTWVGSYLTNQQSQAVRNERIDNQILQIKEAVESLRGSINDGTRQRYTNDDASRDRASLMAAVAAESRRNDSQDATLTRMSDNQQRLLIFMAASEGRQKGKE